MYMCVDNLVHFLSYIIDLQGVNISAVTLFRADRVPVLVQVQIEVFIYKTQSMFIPFSNNFNHSYHGQFVCFKS